MFSIRFYTSCLFLLIFGNSQAIPSKNSQNIEKRVNISQNRILFEENVGQYDKAIKYYAKGKGYNIALGNKTVIELYRYKQEVNKTKHDID